MNSEIHTLADGAEWIYLQIQEIFSQQGMFTYDFYHISEYLGEAAPSCRASLLTSGEGFSKKRLKKGAEEKVIGTFGTIRDT